MLDSDGNVVIVIEVIVTHEPESEVLDFYNSKRIACLQIRIDSFDDCKKIEEKLSSPSTVNLCPTPSCRKCGKKKDHVFEDLTGNSIERVRATGVKLEPRYSKMADSVDVANICPHCNSMIGKFHLHEYTMEGDPIEKVDLGYICGDCITVGKQARDERLRQLMT